MTYEKEVLADKPDYFVAMDPAHGASGGSIIYVTTTPEGVRRVVGRINRVEEDEHGIVASGGWCVPAGMTYEMLEPSESVECTGLGESCSEIDGRHGWDCPISDPLSAIRDAAEAYRYGPRSGGDVSLPSVSARRGGIRYPREVNGDEYSGKRAPGEGGGLNVRHRIKTRRRARSRR